MEEGCTRVSRILLPVGGLLTLRRAQPIGLPGIGWCGRGTGLVPGSGAGRRRDERVVVCPFLAVRRKPAQQYRQRPGADGRRLSVAGHAQQAGALRWIRFEEFSPTNFIAPPNRGTIAMLRAQRRALAGDGPGRRRLPAGSASQAFTEGLPSSIPNGMAEDAEGTLWVAYRSGAVYRLKDGQASACAGQADCRRAVRFRALQ